MQPDGGYVVESITAPEIVHRDFSTQVVTAKLMDFSLTGHVVPGASGSDGSFHSTALHTGRFTWREFPLMSVESFSIEIEPAVAEEALTELTISAAVKGATITLPDEPPQSDSVAGILAALGVDKLTFDFSDSLVWRDTGRLTYSNQTGLDEFGTAQTKAVLRGVTQDKLATLMSLAALARVHGLTDADQASSNALLDLVVEDARIRYDAGPLLPELIDYLGMELGGRDVITAMIEYGILTQVEALKLPALSALARPAVHAFLAEPSSLEARIDPPAPVTFSALTTATTTDKEGLVPLLGLSIAANQPVPPAAP